MTSIGFNVDGLVVVDLIGRLLVLGRFEVVFGCLEVVLGRLLVVELVESAEGEPVLVVDGE